MSKINVILGPPGTGKTTKLLSIVSDALANGILPQKIGFISFTKKSVNEARDRAAIQFKRPVKNFTYFRTIHSLSFRQMAMSSSQIMQRKHYMELGDIMGAKITGIHRQDQMVFEMSKGDQMVFLESLARLTCRTLEKTWQDLNSDLNIEELTYFRESLIKYKKASLVIDFTDMLERYFTEGHKPDLDLLIIDEAQDLCTLQWNIVAQMAKSSKQTFIAGDDDQAIFRWSGADVERFFDLSKKYPTEVLHQSYRLPKSVYEFSNTIVSQIKHRNTKKFKPKKDSGKVDYIGGIEDIDLSTGEWLVLVRNGFMINYIVEYLRSCGYPYETTYYSILQDEALLAARSWERLKKESISILDAKLILSYISQSKTSLRSKPNDEHIDMEEFINLTKLPEETQNSLWHIVLDKIAVEDREYFIAARRQNESFTKTPRIKVSTIHGAKGGEAQNVVLFTDMSAKTYNNMVENYDDELRVFYVGATRSKENLYIVQPQTINHFTI